MALHCDSEATPHLHALPEELDPYQVHFLNLHILHMGENDCLKWIFFPYIGIILGDCLLRISAPGPVRAAAFFLPQKYCLLVVLSGKYTRGLTFENFCSRTCSCSWACANGFFLFNLFLFLLQDLFVQLGVRKRFESRDFVAALERLARCNRGQTLEPEQLALAAA